jgi:hypothetical protein
MAGTRHILNETYVLDQDSTQEYISPVLSLEYPVAGIFYQFVWPSSVRGEFIFEAAIIQDQWEPLTDCEEVKVIADSIEDSSKIVTIPQAWTLVSALRFRWVPYSPTSGTFTVGLRICPT